MAKPSIPTITLRDNRFGDFGLLLTKKKSGNCFEVSQTDNADAYLVAGSGDENSSPERKDIEKSPGLVDGTFDNRVRQILEDYGTRTLGELLSSSKSILDLTPESHLDKADRKELRFFSYEGEKQEGNQIISFRLDTSNLMGVLRFRSKDKKTTVQVQVLSRFDRGENNYFLNYLLSKAFDVSLGTDEVSSSPESILDNLLDLLFIRRLADAVGSVGLFKQYRERRNNDWNFKGRLDLPRHLRENVPLMHGVAYVKREIEHDVPLNEMILLAAKAVRKRRADIFDRNEDARHAIRDLLVAIPNPGIVRDVLRDRTCREPISQPYYREAYEPLRQVAKMILEKEQWSLFADDGDAEVSGVVFDGSWLWEEYLATALANAGFRHGTDPVLRVFKSKEKRFIPDFYRSNGSDEQECDIVLDAKYKRSNPAGQREDVHQVLCYLLLTGAKRGGLVFPPVEEIFPETVENEFVEEDVVEEKKDGGWSDELDIVSPGNDLKWRCFSWAPILPKDTTSWNAFCEYMQGQEDALVKKLSAGL